MYKIGQTLVYCGNRTFRTIVNDQKRYWEIRDCNTCGNIFLADKYSNVRHCSQKCKGNTRGRPIGTELKQETKTVIAHGRTGLHHTKETIQKISEQVKIGMEDSIFEGGFLAGEIHPWYKHGDGGTPIWQKWAAIKQRCNNPNNKNYKYYGAKDIKMCEKWAEDFTSFRDWCLNNGHDTILHLHRTEPLGDYSPENCVFLTPSEHSKIHNKLRRLSNISG